MTVSDASSVTGAMPSAARPYKSVTEATRERETFKYDPFLFADFHFNNTGKLLPSSSITSSSDSTLTGLAQLVAYQTGTDRAFVSLFDTGHQYVVAEAVPGMPLAPNLPSEQCPSPLSLCGTAIPRSHGTCEHVLYLKNPDAADETTLPFSIISNLAVDERFNTRPYCQFDERGQFYAAVPIRSHRGINIGSFCVMSPTKPSTWGDHSIECLRDVSRAVMNLLENNRSRNINNSNERLNKGVRAFIAGESSLTDWPTAGDAAAFDTGLRPTADSRPVPSLQAHSSTIAEVPLPTHEPSAGAETTNGTDQPPVPAPQTNGEGAHERQKRRRRRPGDAFSGPNPGGRAAPSRHEKPKMVFSRAANIMRESFDVDGCLFFDVSHASVRRQSIPKPAHAEDNGSQPSATSSSDDPSPEAAIADPDTACDIIGFSTTNQSGLNLDTTHEGGMGMVQKRMLATLIKRYPEGKTFNFDNVGELQSSDSSDEGETEREVRREQEANTSSGTQQRRMRRHIREGVLINQAFPNARSVAFIPIWDLKRERWFAAGFLYTCLPTRIFTMDEELSFLKAFTSLAATEVLNQEVVLADQAKADALGSLSHELRSPLHGVLLATELLTDTDLDVFQGNLTHTIEMCCCTLLDSIDHLLDFSKVNSFASKRKRAAKDHRGVRKAEKPAEFGKQLMVNVNLDDLVEEVADSMFAGYSFQHLSTGKNATLDGLMHAGGHARTRERLELVKKDHMTNGELASAGETQGVSVYLSIDQSCSWSFHIQPGAIRRVVMNLLGNALKYTQKGNICLFLTQERVHAKRARSETIVKLVVQDSGKGMSRDFLQHKMYTPFSQEDELAPGTGLGLSLVKAIVNGMGGHINAESELGVGSTFSVTMPLEPSGPQPSETDASTPQGKAFSEQAQALSGLRVRIFGFKKDEEQARGGNGRAILESICRDWLKVELPSPGNKPEATPDIVLWSHEALPGSTEELTQLEKMPHVIVCQDAQMARRLSKEYESAGYEGVLEFVSQPVGPRKLARSMQHAYKRWTGLTKASPPMSTPAVKTNGEERKPGFRIGIPSPLEELNSLALDSRLTPRNEQPPEMLSLNQSLSVLDGDRPNPRRRYTDKDTFLLVDDNPVNLNVLAAYMAKLKFNYVTAVNGKEALETYKREPSQFTAILMDVSMPVMDGLEATRQIRAFEWQNKLKAVTVLALTGLASDRTHKEAFESGVDVFLTKPVRLQTLRHELGLTS
ncbi:histidine kinase-, DNA gyrase b-, and HSP90-like ATPase domain-containing protein [Sarocladium implicatum]|nr:histidine kinase-, DNA gyrase b-, and HSP90-like ATPase domain-containing protein [Sarocladium implicatum]